METNKKIRENKNIEEINLDYCDWLCDGCNEYLNWQSGFSTKTGEYTCKYCGTVNSVTIEDLVTEF